LSLMWKYCAVLTNFKNTWKWRLSINGIIIDMVRMA
jgi:hypothetical protein